MEHLIVNELQNEKRKRGKQINNKYKAVQEKRKKTRIGKINTKKKKKML